MTQLQRYLFIDSLRAFAIIMSGLVTMVLLTQGLSQSELILENQESATLYLKVVILGSPKVFGLLMPLGLFVACVWSLNRIHRDSEIIVAQASGMTTWQVSSPILRLASIVMVLHLVVSLWVQPASQREMRETLHEAKADFASSLLTPGEFTSAGTDVTFYVRDNLGGVLSGLFISDQGLEPADYIASTGNVTRIDGQPALIMKDGEIHQIEDDGSLSILVFDRYVFDLAPLAQEDSELFLKASDRYLHELFTIDSSHFYEAANYNRFLAEANYRLSAPLLNLVMALLALLAVFEKDYRKSGHLKRIGIVGLVALGILFLSLVANSVAVERPVANILQWIIPISAFIALSTSRFRLNTDSNMAPQSVPA